LHAPTNEGGP
nr:oestradiol-receptor=P2 peptide [swine, Peptide, 10 aa] [Sus scrofa]